MPWNWPECIVFRIESMFLELVFMLILKIIVPGLKTIKFRKKIELLFLFVFMCVCFCLQPPRKNELSWYIMINDISYDQSWSIMIYHDQSWSIMTSHDHSWSVMISYDQLWLVMMQNVKIPSKSIEFDVKTDAECKTRWK